MVLSSFPSRKYLPNSVAQRGMGGFLDNLLTTVGNYTAGQQSVDIANSQAAAATAQAQAAAQSAYAQAAMANKPALSPATLLLIAGGLGAVLLIMKKRRG
jgi:hypothetical protein